MGVLRVNYKKPKHGWGRVFPQKSLGLTGFGKATRNTLIDGLYYDFDLENAQPCIIQNICKSNGIRCPNVDAYCADRDTVLNNIATAYGVERKPAKRLMLRLCFFGTFKGWCNELNVVDKKPLDFITNFERELRDIAENKGGQPNSLRVCQKI